MTGDSEEPREQCKTWRFGLAMIGGFLVTTSIWPLARILGGGGEPENLQLGFPLAMVILATIAVVGFLFCFKLTRERVYDNQGPVQHSPWQDIRAMLTNSQWLVIALATFIIQFRGGMAGATRRTSSILPDQQLRLGGSSVPLFHCSPDIRRDREPDCAVHGAYDARGVAGVIAANRMIRRTARSASCRYARRHRVR